MIDLHTHILPRDLPDLDAKYGYSGWVHLDHHEKRRARMVQGGHVFRVIDDNCWDPEVRLAECDRLGVQVQVLSTVPVMFGYWAPAEHALEVARRLNDDIADTVARWPTRFVGLGTIPLQDVPKSIAELERCMKGLRMPGVQIGSHVNGANLDDERFEPFWEAADALGAAVLVHPWDMMGRDTMERHWLPWLVSMPAESTRAMVSLMMGGIVERFPNVRFLFVHGGGAFAGTVGRIDHGFRVRPDLCQTRTTTLPSVLARRVWVDTAVHDPRALQLLLDVFEPERIALGTDYPFPLGEHRPGEAVEQAELAPELARSILHDAPLRWLGERARTDLGAAAS